MYLENDKYQHRNIEIIALFVTNGMQQRGTSRHVLIIYIVSSLVIIFFSVDFIPFIFFHYMSTNISTNISNTIIMIEIETILCSNAYLIMYTWGP